MWDDESKYTRKHTRLNFFFTFIDYLALNFYACILDLLFSQFLKDTPGLWKRKYISFSGSKQTPFLRFLTAFLRFILDFTPCFRVRWLTSQLFRLQSHVSPCSISEFRPLKTKRKENIGFQEKLRDEYFREGQKNARTVNSTIVQVCSIVSDKDIMVVFLSLWMASFRQKSLTQSPKSSGWKWGWLKKRLNGLRLGRQRVSLLVWLRLQKHQRSESCKFKTWSNFILFWEQFYATPIKRIHFWRGKKTAHGTN